MNTLQQQFDLLSNDLARYGHITAALESATAVDIGQLRGDYTDLYHRYVTCQPHLFKRKALSIGTEGALEVAGAVFLLGILAKIAAWVAKAFFGESSSGSGGGGGSNKLENFEKRIKKGEYLKALKDTCEVLKKGTSAKPSEEELGKLDKNKAFLLCGKYQDKITKHIADMLKVHKAHESEIANTIKTVQALHNKMDDKNVVVKDMKEFTEFSNYIEKHTNAWKPIAEQVDEMRSIYTDEHKVSCKGMSIAQMAIHIENAATHMLSDTVLEIVSGVIIINESMEDNQKILKSMKSNTNPTPNQKTIEQVISREIVMSRQVYKVIYELFDMADAHFRGAAEWLVAEALKCKDAFDETTMAEIKEKAEVLKKSSFGVKMKVFNTISHI